MYRIWRVPTVRSGSGGFTLLELLTVMAIMLILMTIAVGAYHGMSIGSGIRGSVSNVRMTLSLARQFAMTHRKRTYVFFNQDSTNSHYLACAQFGEVDGTEDQGRPSQNFFFDNTARWGIDDLKGQVIYNLTKEVQAPLTANAVTSFTARLRNGVTWEVGNRYGMAVHDQEHLPKGFVFARPDWQPWPLQQEMRPMTVVFNPDGTTERSAGTDYEIRIREYRGPAQTVYAKATVRVSGLTGTIRVEE